MLEVTLSEHYQVAIPKEICDSLHFTAGQKFSLELKDGLIALVSQPSMQLFRGILKGADTNNIRDRSDRQ